jgi:hypothetical protein
MLHSTEVPVTAPDLGAVEGGMAGAQRSRIMLRTLGMLLMVVLPGGLVVLSAYILARVVAEKARLEDGPTGRRFARAFSAVRLKDVMRVASGQLSLPRAEPRVR